MSEPTENDKALFLSLQRSIEQFNASQDLKAEKERAYYEQLESVLEASNQTSVWIQGLLFIENELTNMLRNVVASTRRDHIGGSGWKPSLSDKVTLLHLIGVLSDDDRSVINKLIKIRNNMAHINIEDRIPRVSDDDVHELWSAMRTSFREQLSVNYDQNIAAVENLRATLLNLVIRYRILARVIGSEFGLADVVRYNTTGDTVTQRIATQEEMVKSDNNDVRAVKHAFLKLRSDDRRNFRLWLIEIYHHD